MSVATDTDLRASTGPARRWRQTCATRQTSTHSSCGGTGSWRHPAACLRLPATDGTSLPHTRCVHRAAQPWIDITRQLLFECVREFDLHDIETEFERTKQIAQAYILHALVDCFIIATIMSERPLSTNESQFPDVPGKSHDPSVPKHEYVKPFKRTVEMLKK